MRTKHLLTAMVLPTLFAACTNEELDVVNNVESLGGRAVVENVKFNLSESASSRLVYDVADAEYVWQAGDQVGACLMDVITDEYWNTAADWEDRFELVDYIQTNYKFTRNADGEWGTEAKMCEGNYFLAFPYDANQGIRAAYSFSCADQTLEGTSRSALGKAFAKNNSFVGYLPVERGANESVATSMTPVFEATGFTLKNTGTDSYTIEKIVLSGKKVSSFAVVNPTNNNYTLGAANKKMLEYTTGDRIDVAIKSGNRVNRQGSINLIVMSGTSEALVEGQDDAYLEIHTDKGLIRGIDLAKKYTSANGELGDDETVNVLTDKALTALGKADKVNITFDDTSLDIPNEMDIYSTDELYRLIKWNAAVKDVDVIANLKASVDLTAEMYDILKNSGKYGKDKSTLTINGSNLYEVTVKADVPADAMDLVSFNQADVNIEGVQTITKPVTVGVDVYADATFNVAANVTNTIKNNGTVNVKATATINELINKGAVVVDANLSTELYNLGSLTINATLSAKGQNYGTLNNYGTLEAMSGVALKNMNKDLYYDNIKYTNPLINNYGKILDVENNNLIIMMNKEARINEADGRGEIDNTVQSDYIKTENVKNTVFVKVSDLAVTKLHEIVLNADATKVYLSGTLTIDPEIEGGEIKVTQVTEIIAESELSILGKGKVWFSESPSFTISSKTETIVNNGATLSIVNGELLANGLLTIKNNAQVICGTAKGNIENYGKLKENTQQTSAISTQELKDALTNGEDVIFESNISVSNTETETNGYGTTGINVNNGQTIDGNGKTINVQGANGTWDSCISTTGGLIKNLTVASGFRGIFVHHNSSYSEKVVLENVIIDGPVYTISCDQGTNKGLEATGCTFNGWTSYAKTLGDALFVDCKFGEGSGYAFCRPYAPTTFTDCEFQEGYKLNPIAKVELINCSLNGVALTDSNINKLILGDLSLVTVK